MRFLLLLEHTLLLFETFVHVGFLWSSGGWTPLLADRWIVDMENAFQRSIFPEGSKGWFASFLLKYIASDWWPEVGHDLVVEAIQVMTCDDFVTKFMA